MTGHLQHIVEALAFMVVVIGGIALSERLGRSRQRGAPPEAAARETRRNRPRPMILLPLVGIASAGAASVHLVVLPQHIHEAALYGAFFAIVASFQLALALGIVGWPSRRLLVAAMLGNLSVVLIWLFTRIVAIPLGPAAGTTEAFAGLDVVASAFEVTVVVASIPLLRRSSLSSALHPSAWSPVLVPVAVIAAAAIPLSNWIAPVSG